MCVCVCVQGAAGQRVKATLCFKSRKFDTHSAGFGVWSDWPDLNDLCVRTGVGAVWGSPRTSLLTPDLCQGHSQLAGNFLRTLANIPYLVNVLKKCSKKVLRRFSHFKYCFYKVE